MSQVVGREFEFWQGWYYVFLFFVFGGFFKFESILFCQDGGFSVFCLFCFVFMLMGCFLVVLMGYFLDGFFWFRWFLVRELCFVRYMELWKDEGIVIVFVQYRFWRGLLYGFSDFCVCIRVGGYSFVWKGEGIMFV